MGLDTTHNCWHGPYSHFGQWRDAIAQAAGVKDWIRENPQPTNAELFGRWKTTPPDPLLVLWSHSDCDGIIQPAQGLPLAEALLRLVPQLKDGYRGATLRFAAGLLLAASRNENVEFQ